LRLNHLGARPERQKYFKRVTLAAVFDAEGSAAARVAVRPSKPKADSRALLRSHRGRAGSRKAASIVQRERADFIGVPV
jgi:hypothetical protein